MTRKISLGIGASDTFVHQCDHIAYFWETEEQFAQAVGFLEVGIELKDHCVIFGHDEANDKVQAILRQHGKPVEELHASGKLSILTAESTGDATLQKIGNTFQRALDDGAPMIRLLGNIGWHRPNWPNERDILAFEAKVTDAARAFPCVVVCMYDVNALSGKIVMRGGIETHPVTIRGNVVRENPLYVTVEEYFKKLESNQSSPENAVTNNKIA